MNVKRITIKSLILGGVSSVVLAFLIVNYAWVDDFFLRTYAGVIVVIAVNDVGTILSPVWILGFIVSITAVSIIAKLLGGKRYEDIQSFMSASLIIVAVLGIFICLIFSLIGENILISFVDMDAELISYAYHYLKFISFFIPFLLGYILMQVFIIIKCKFLLSTSIAVVGFLLKIFLGYMFIASWNFGIAGAALSSGIAYLVSALICFLYLLYNKNDVFYFGKPRFNIQVES